jgi:uncharacterized protein YcbK (DUF882 family)
MSKNLLTVSSAFSLISTKDYDQLVNRNITTNFKWGEVFTGIRPNEWKEVNKSMLENAFRLALYLEKLRDYFGKPIIITSWLRVPSHNKRIGGASKSMHLTGLAVDFNVKGVPFDRNQMARLNEFHVGGLARADYNKDGWADFVHIDLGKEREWTY